jgi:ADP-ribose pyrophosphatase YjhB (NUDIX family)
MGLKIDLLSIIIYWILINKYKMEVEIIHSTDSMLDEDGNEDTQDRCGIILLDSTYNILTVVGKDTGKVSFPKGKRKVKETEWEAAVRECKEEAGLDLESPFVKSRIYFLEKIMIDDIHYFVFYYPFPGFLLVKEKELDSPDTSKVFWMNMVIYNTYDCNHTLRKFIGYSYPASYFKKIADINVKQDHWIYIKNNIQIYFKK